MISLNKLLRNSFFLSVLITIYFLGCSKEPETKKYIARVNNAYLTEEDVSELDSLFEQGFSRNELIKKWIEKELLYQEAMKKGIADNEDFNRIINNSRRELASSMLLNSYLETNLKKPSISQLQEFFDVHKSEFKTEENVYIFNSASFSNENVAIKFRTKLIETSWEKAIENYSEDKSLIEFKTSNALAEAEIYPIQRLSLIDVLNPGEVSIVLEENAAEYSVIQLLQIFRKGNNPPFEIIRNEVEARYIADKREQIFNEYIEELYSNNEIEIKEK
jgi:PPIC-type PPIASE domain